jgi:hypothetical protein
MSVVAEMVGKSPIPAGGFMTTLFSDPPRCPHCGTENAVPLIFGPPTQEMLVAEQLGHIVLGGPGEGREKDAWACPSRSCRSFF